ncbi:MAG: LPS assembly lipoprotein LptE [Puniceicoccaceae bacterium]
MKRAHHAWPIFLIAVVLSGCAGYEPVETADEPVAIAVAPVINESDLAQIIAPLTRNLREGIAHSPNWRLTGEDTAAAVLHLTIVELEQDALARDPADTGRPLSFNSILRVKVEWESELPPPWGGDPVIEVETDQIIYSQPSLVNAQTTATAQMADRLAAAILQKLDWMEPAR